MAFIIYFLIGFFLSLDAFDVTHALLFGLGLVLALTIGKIVTLLPITLLLPVEYRRSHINGLEKIEYLMHYVLMAIISAQINPDLILPTVTASALDWYLKRSSDKALGINNKSLPFPRDSLRPNTDPLEPNYKKGKP